LPYENREATNRYLGWLAVACLIIFPFIGVGAIVIWVLTALGMHGIRPLSDRKREIPRAKPRCNRKRPRR
jgi:hypothetical protein